MSPVLTRLVARAAGLERSGLRPRLPARFEPAGPAELAEVQTFAQASGTEPSPGPAPAESVSPRRDPIAPAAEADAPRLRVVPPRPTPGLRMSPAPVAKAGERGKARERGTPHAEAPRGPDTVPSRHPATPAAGNVRAVAPAAAAPPPERPIELGRRDRARGPAPPPLLPHQPEPRNEPSIGADARRGPPAAAVARRMEGRRPVLGPPDIVVHVGQVDVRAAPEPPKPPVRRRTPGGGQQTTPLGDYLRGRDGRQ